MKGNFVKETSLTTGAGLTLTLVEVTDWARLSAVASIAIGDTFEYALFNSAGKEVGIGTKQAGNTFDRTIVISTLVGATYNDSTAVKLTLVGESTFIVTLSAESTIDINNTVFNKALWKSTATLNGTAINGHVNLGSGNSITGTAAQAYDFCTIGGGEDNQAFNTHDTVSGGFDNVIAGSGFCVIAGGWGNDITAGSYATIGGGQVNIASANFTTIGGGGGCNATKGYATVGGGKNSKATGDFSFVGGGQYGRASGLSSVVCGGGGGNTLENEAQGSYDTVVGGYNNICSGTYGFIGGGKGNQSAHAFASASGAGSLTRADFDMVHGATDTATPSVANNVARLTSAGNLLIDGAVSSPEADIGEMMEWGDGNSADKDRIGFFVSLVEGKMEIGNANIKGITSATASIIGNAAPNHWRNMYLKDKLKRTLKTRYTLIEWVDEWGDEQRVYQAEDFTLYDEYPQPTSVNGIISDKTPIGNLKNKTVFTPTINPAFDIDLDYIPRSERKEWDVVGIHGIILVYTNEPITGWKVDANPDGKASNGITYDVMNHIDDNTVEIFYERIN